MGGPWPGGSCSPQANNSKSHLLTSVSPGHIAAYRLLAYGDGARTNGSYTEMDGAAIHLDDNRAPVGQGGVNTIEFAVDGDPVRTVDQACTIGGYPLSASL